MNQEKINQIKEKLKKKREVRFKGSLVNVLKYDFPDMLKKNIIEGFLEKAIEIGYETALEDFKKEKKKVG